MAERVALTRLGVAVVMSLLVAGALTTALLLYGLTDAPLPLIVLITCLVPAPMILMLYAGYRIYTDPQQSSALKVLRLLGLAAMSMAGVVVLDFVLPAKVLSSQVTAVYSLDENRQMVQFTTGRVPVDSLYVESGTVFEGQIVTVKETTLFDRIDETTAGQDNTVIYSRPLKDRLVMLAAAALCLVPLALFRFHPERYCPRMNMAGYVLLVAPSFVISLVCLGFWTKLLLVHLFGVVESM